MSVCYRVHRYEPRPDAATGQTIDRAMDWEPFEISTVPIPMDAAAAHAEWRRVAGQLRPKAPKSAELMVAAKQEVAIPR